MSDKIEQFWRPATADDVARWMKGEDVKSRFWHNLQCPHEVYDPPQWYLNKPDPGEGYRLLEKFPPEQLRQGDEYWSRRENKWLPSPVAATGSHIQLNESWYRRRIETKPKQCVGWVCSLAESTGVFCPHDSCDLETGVRETNNPEIPDSSNSLETPNSCRSRDTIPSGWRLLSKEEERLANDAYWSLGAKDWVIIGDDRVAFANELPRWHAIRQMDRASDFYLHENCHYKLPNGQYIRITAKGFEVG